MSEGTAANVITREHLWDALDYLITDWREAMRSALLQTPAPALRHEGAKTAAWLSFGFDAANYLYPYMANHRLLQSKIPAGRVGAALSRVALPVWAISELQRYVGERYAAKVEHLDESLYRSHRRVCEQMVGDVQVIARDFGATKYAGEAMDALDACLAGKPYDREHSVAPKIREVIADSRLVDSDQRHIANQVHSALSPVVEKVRMMADACPEVSGLSHPAELWYAPNGDMTWRKTLGGVGYVDHRWQIIRGQPEALKLMAHAHRMEVWQVPGSRLQHRPLRTFVICRFPNRRPQDFLHSFGNVRGEWTSALRSAADRMFGETRDVPRQAS